MGIYDDMAKEIDQLRKEVEELRDREVYLQELAANPYLSASQKWVMWAACKKLGYVAREGEQLSEVEVYEIGKMVGMSRWTVGSNLSMLADCGAIARDMRKEKIKDSQGRETWKTHIKLGLTLFSKHPSEIKPRKARNHGGKRQQCEKCGGENLEVYEAYICQDCGHIHHAELKKETKGRHGFS